MAVLARHVEHLPDIELIGVIEVIQGNQMLGGCAIPPRNLFQCITITHGIGAVGWLRLGRLWLGVRLGMMGRWIVGWLIATGDAKALARIDVVPVVNGIDLGQRVRVYPIIGRNVGERLTILHSVIVGTLRSAHRAAVSTTIPTRDVKPLPHINVIRVVKTIGLHQRVHSGAMPNSNLT